MAFDGSLRSVRECARRRVNLFVRHLMRQRPSLFNYATPVFHDRPELFCEKIEPAQSVLDAANPLFTEQEPLPILATPIPIGINFCVQITHAEIDFHPGNAIDLPPELAKLPEQRFALRARACAGVDCPPQEMIDEQLRPVIERIILEQQELAIDGIENENAGSNSRSAAAGRAAARTITTHRKVSIAVPQGGATTFPGRDIIVLPTRKLICFCLEVFAVGYFEWGSVAGSQQQWLKPRLDGIEIVDLQPSPMEEAIECYVSTVLRLGILPRLMVPTEKMVLDITAVLKEQGLALEQKVTLVPANVPNNPAIEEDMIKAFVKLVVKEGGP